MSSTAQRLQPKYPRVKLAPGSASTFEEMLKDAGLTQVNDWIMPQNFQLEDGPRPAVRLTLLPVPEWLSGSNMAEIMEKERFRPPTVEEAMRFAVQKPVIPGKEKSGRVIFPHKTRYSPEGHPIILCVCWHEDGWHLTEQPANGNWLEGALVAVVRKH